MCIDATDKVIVFWFQYRINWWRIISYYWNDRLYFSNDYILGRNSDDACAAIYNFADCIDWTLSIELNSPFAAVERLNCGAKNQGINFVLWVKWLSIKVVH